MVCGFGEPSIQFCRADSLHVARPAPDKEDSIMQKVCKLPNLHAPEL
jgi:hypothetical protein